MWRRSRASVTDFDLDDVSVESFPARYDLFQFMSTSELRTQSAVARRAAEAEVRTLIVKFASAHQRLIGATRRWLRKRLATAHEVVYEYRDCFVISYSPSERGYEGVLAIRASADGVKLYFNRGKGLRDPERLLRGSGSQTRRDCERWLIR